MPKPLRDESPTSSVARFFDREAASRAVIARRRDVAALSSTGTRHYPPLSHGEADAAQECIPVKREFTLSDEADQTCSALLDMLRRSTGTRMSSSHLLRGMFKGIAACLPAVESEARRIGRLKLPSNARGRDAERTTFEQRLAEVLINGIRSAAAYRGLEPNGGA